MQITNNKLIQKPFIIDCNIIIITIRYCYLITKLNTQYSNICNDSFHNAQRRSVLCIAEKKKLYSVFIIIFYK
jgi:hypothetical protein